MAAANPTTMAKKTPVRTRKTPVKAAEPIVRVSVDEELDQPYRKFLIEDLEKKRAELNEMMRGATKQWNLGHAYKRRFQVAGMAATSVAILMAGVILLVASVKR